jgi:hypothetical protein
MIIHKTEFPFEEIKDVNGDYFTSVTHALEHGFDENQVWSVVIEDDVWVYGPSHHYINLIGYIATEEHHDGDTYYEEQY